MSELCDFNNNEPVSTIFFDLDNTVIHTRKADSEACAKLVEVLQEQYGVTAAAAVESAATFLRRFRRLPDNDAYELDEWREHLWRNALPKEVRKFAGDIFVQWIELRYHYLALSSDVIQLLTTLREHYLLGLITNGPSRAQWEKVERLQLRQFFDCILVSGDLPWEKPDQHIFLRACKLLHVEPKQCIMVGDKLETDIQGGKEAELGGTVWIPISESDRTEESTTLPDFTIDSVTELPDVLASPKPRQQHCEVEEDVA